MDNTTPVTIVLPEKSRIIAVDFDGTVCTHSFPDSGKDIGAAPVLKKLVEAGHRLFLWTVRDGQHLSNALKWFEDNDITLWGINENPTQKSWSQSPKAHADLFIDDLACGAFLTHDSTVSSRPYINWASVEFWLIKNGYLPAPKDEQTGSY